MDRSIFERREKFNLRKDGWLVFDVGYPDFFCYHKNKKEYKFVEVKGGGDVLSQAQKKMHRIMKIAGLNVEVKNSGGPIVRKSVRRRIREKDIARVRREGIMEK